MKMMTVKEYAEHVSSNPSTIRTMCRSGVLPSVKIGVGWRIDADRADRYFADLMDSRERTYIKRGRGKIDYLDVIHNKLRRLAYEGS